MMMTAKTITPPATSKANILQLNEKSEKSKERQIAEVGLSAPVLNAITAKNFTKVGDIDLTEAVTVMREKVSKVNAGDLNELEATLTAQSVSLDAIFNELARRAINSDTMSKLEIYMRLSLKAQAQCARTIEVLAAMKNPPVIFAKQANIANGHQQINNGNQQENASTHSRAQEIESQPNELLEVNHGSKTMDTRTAQTASRKDKAMATVAK